MEQEALEHVKKLEEQREDINKALDTVNWEDEKYLHGDKVSEIDMMSRELKEYREQMLRLFAFEGIQKLEAAFKEHFGKEIDEDTAFIRDEIINGSRMNFDKANKVLELEPDMIDRLIVRGPSKAIARVFERYINRDDYLLKRIMNIQKPSSTQIEDWEKKYPKRTDYYNLLIMDLFNEFEKKPEHLFSKEDRAMLAFKPKFFETASLFTQRRLIAEAFAVELSYFVYALLDKFTISANQFNDKNTEIKKLDKEIDVRNASLKETLEQEERKKKNIEFMDGEEKRIEARLKAKEEDLKALDEEIAKKKGSSDDSDGEDDGEG